mmetsp:Transcript_18851/g.54495  ORF Transcript_18851/g.54495 Transcript_18851/m.54495 type:complete len:449 (-) Transcript_18851:612-1958(-)
MFASSSGSTPKSSMSMPMVSSSSSSTSSSPESSSESDPNNTPSNSSSTKPVFIRLVFLRFPFLSPLRFLELWVRPVLRCRAGASLLLELLLPLSELASSRAFCSSKYVVQRNHASVTSASSKIREPSGLAWPTVCCNTSKILFALFTVSHFPMTFRTMKSTLLMSFFDCFRLIPSPRRPALPTDFCFSGSAFACSFAGLREFFTPPAESNSAEQRSHASVISCSEKVRPKGLSAPTVLCNFSNIFSAFAMELYFCMIYLTINSTLSSLSSSSIFLLFLPPGLLLSAAWSRSRAEGNDASLAAVGFAASSLLLLLLLLEELAPLASKCALTFSHARSTSSRENVRPVGFALPTLRRNMSKNLCAWPVALHFVSTLRTMSSTLPSFLCGAAEFAGALPSPGGATAVPADASGGAAAAGCGACCDASGRSPFGAAASAASGGVSPFVAASC